MIANSHGSVATAVNGRFFSPKKSVERVPKCWPDVRTCRNNVDRISWTQNDNNSNNEIIMDMHYIRTKFFLFIMPQICKKVISHPHALSPTNCQ